MCWFVCVECVWSVCGVCDGALFGPVLSGRSATPKWQVRFFPWDGPSRRSGSCINAWGHAYSEARVGPPSLITSSFSPSAWSVEGRRKKKMASSPSVPGKQVGFVHVCLQLDAGRNFPCRARRLLRARHPHAILRYGRKPAVRTATIPPPPPLNLCTNQSSCAGGGGGPTGGHRLCAFPARAWAVSKFAKNYVYRSVPWGWSCARQQERAGGGRVL